MTRAVIAMCALGATLMACSAGDPSNGAAATTRSAVVPACEYDPYYCDNAPFAMGAWVGDSGPFAALVLTDKLCSDRGYCFAGALADGTHIEGDYFDKPQRTLFSWSGGSKVFEGYDVVGDVLTFYAGPEGDIIPVATLHAVDSWCGEVNDCSLQTLKSMPCDDPFLKCRDNRCKPDCGRHAGKCARPKR